MRSEAESVADYLASLPEERRQAIGAVRAVILESLPDGFEETMNWGMICYEVPLSVCPDTYNGQPLMYAALASQKNHMAVYLTSIYADERARQAFERDYAATGKRMDCGKSCVRFRSLDDLPLEVIGRAIAHSSVEDFVERARTARAERTSSRKKR